MGIVVLREHHTAVGVVMAVCVKVRTPVASEELVQQGSSSESPLKAYMTLFFFLSQY